MSSTFRINAPASLRIPANPEDREYQQIPETSLAVSRLGDVRDGDRLLGFDDFPHTVVASRCGFWKLHVPAAVALLWLSKDERGWVGRRANGEISTRSPVIRKLAQEYRVWPSAIAHVVRTPESDLRYFFPIEDHSWIDAHLHHLDPAVVKACKTAHADEYRPPNQGGNSLIIHRHTITIEDQNFTCLARGARLVIQPGDQISFDYAETGDGVRAIIPWSVITPGEKDWAPVPLWPRPAWTLAPPRP